MSIVAEAPGYLQVFSDGSVKRFEPEIASVSEEESKIYGYKSKDVTIDPSKPITGRIFLPTNPKSSNTGPLPILVYFHGGGFCIGSTKWLGYHHFLGTFSVISQSIVVSIDYRLAPENKLPIAYEDCYSSLEWLSHQVSSEPWLKNADLSHVFLSGDSAGGNIAHNVALKFIQKNDEVINQVMKIKGLLLIHPYFGSEKRSEQEISEGNEQVVKTNDMFWRLSIPEGLNRDYHGCNFEKSAEQVLESQWKEFPDVIVFVAGLDFLKERGVMYAKFMERNKNVKVVKLVEAEKESHVFHVFYPESEATRLLQTQMTHFIQNY